MGKDTHPNFMLCGTCHGLYEDKPQPAFATPNLRMLKDRRAEVAALRLQRTSPPLRVLQTRAAAERAALVRLVLQECKARVRNLNSITGRYVIPIGRHSLMGGIGIEGSELVGADNRRFNELVDGFADQMGGWDDSIDHLQAFAARRTVFLTDAVGLDATRDLQLDTWLQRVRPRRRSRSSSERKARSTHSFAGSPRTERVVAGSSAWFGRRLRSRHTVPTLLGRRPSPHKPPPPRRGLAG